MRKCVHSTRSQGSWSRPRMPRQIPTKTNRIKASHRSGACGVWLTLPCRKLLYANISYANREIVLGFAPAMPTMPTATALIARILPAEKHDSATTLRAGRLIHTASGFISQMAVANGWEALF